MSQGGGALLCHGVNGPGDLYAHASVAAAAAAAATPCEVGRRVPPQGAAHCRRRTRGIVAPKRWQEPSSAARSMQLLLPSHGGQLQ